MSAVSLPRKEFKPLLELPNGCPSEDTFERVMQAVHPDEIAACSQVYTSQIIKDLYCCPIKLLQAHFPLHQFSDYADIGQQ